MATNRFFNRAPHAALADPDAFRAGWADGVTRVWPGWVLVCEGETVLGCRRAPEAR